MNILSSGSEQAYTFSGLYPKADLAMARSVAAISPLLRHDRKRNRVTHGKQASPMASLAALRNDQERLSNRGFHL
jgi:hypothetical protein